MFRLADWGRLLRTVRHLRPSQVGWRARYLVQRRWEQQSWCLLARRVAARMPSDLAARDDFPHLPAHRTDRLEPAKRLDEVRKGWLTLLNDQRPFRGGADWRLIGDHSGQRLWTYHLHYHEWLLDLVEDPAIRDEGRAQLLDIVRDWTDTCVLGARGFTDFPWNSYTIATRIEWWIRCWRALGGLDGAEGQRWLRSLAEQAEYLCTHLEWDLRANHLLRDARGLAFAGRFIGGGLGRRWLRLAARLAQEQIAEQLLPDGGHFERSAMYHVHAMEDLWAVALLIEDKAIAADLRAGWSAMADYLRWVRHPDGEIPLLNDAAIGAVCHPRRLLALAGSLGLEADAASPRGGKYFPASGLVVWHGRPWTLFFDAGALGPDYQPGHGHADTLTFECSMGGERFVVDPGTFAYDDNAQRRYDRSTAAHNTVAIDGRDSSEVWHIFRVGRRARARDVRVEFDESSLTAEASHDGYDNLPGRPAHVRRIRLVDGGRIEITDRVEGGGTHRLCGGLLIAPGWRVEPCGGGWRVDGPAGRGEVRIEGPNGLKLAREAAAYHPEFGLELEATRLAWSVECRLPVEIRTKLEKT